jgi:hypothetical protein
VDEPDPFWTEERRAFLGRMMYGDGPGPDRDKMSAEEIKAELEWMIGAMCQIEFAVKGRGPKPYYFSYDPLDPPPPQMFVDGICRSPEEHADWPAWHARWLEWWLREFDYKVDPWDPESGLS